MVLFGPQRKDKHLFLFLELRRTDANLSQAVPLVCLGVLGEGWEQKGASLSISDGALAVCLSPYRIPRDQSGFC